MRDSQVFKRVVEREQIGRSLLRQFARFVEVNLL